ncbi:cell fate (sporulation/competence/biofilm development) regulator YlbF (YheA/YmcA/DUF963 family) [Melghiribacillus thermohalophilus]|uniref:Cell fate (Sporulation/competence/biofilm development) regulator YlbF (YheA/YmcA/DUF963 family) n=1 Tax=Melghiribacillus thermohalophilus TaxID=1324956 RepID=A0A4R3NBB8_9BACI|nr:YlbF family regulator [Melghiribacillus thermohalophilus]TCT26897.1 cell fate (sporulation/competence/biofilm development) regulator YlbF (YheA/YmcA/DUF963 family) [Melghiribacillus thermohalophilus]
MIATMEIVELLDYAEEIGKMILHSEPMKNYQQARKRLEEDEEAQKRIAAFQKIKDQYEDVQRFGRYHPDYNEIMKNVRTIKREMDLHDSVAAFKKAERELQLMLDDISSLVAHTVSPHIKVPKEGLLFADSGCGCGSGGSCGCAS